MSTALLVLAIVVAWLALGTVIAFLLGAVIARVDEVSRVHVPEPRRSSEDLASRDEATRQGDDSRSRPQHH